MIHENEQKITGNLINELMESQDKKYTVQMIN